MLHLDQLQADRPVSRYFL